MMNRSTPPFIQLILLLLLQMFIVCSTMRCLVIRPGYGIVSEMCPKNTVACRMRIESHALVWYQYSTYDRNQLACILKGEYGRLSQRGDGDWHRDWCQRKERGTMRCWCAGGDDCNRESTMARIYREFIAVDSPDLLDEVMQYWAQVDDDDDNSSLQIRTMPTPPTHRARQPRRTTTTPAANSTNDWKLLSKNDDREWTTRQSMTKNNRAPADGQSVTTFQHPFILIITLIYHCLSRMVV